MVPPTRTRRPLSRDRVLATAMKLADAEGIGAVTMRRLAAELGIEAMSLYHHLPGKDGLLDGLVEALVAEITAAIEERGEPTGPWTDRLRSRCLVAREVMLRHPWGPGLVTSRRNIPAGAFGLYEAALATMVEGGLSYSLGHRGLHALGSFVLGFVNEVFSPDTGGDDDPVEEDLAAMAAQVPHLTAMAAAELHAAGEPTLGWCDSQVEFEFTLDLLLDGLDRARRAPAERGRTLLIEGHASGRTSD